jgi:hypothetical protein
MRHVFLKLMMIICCFHFPLKARFQQPLFAFGLNWSVQTSNKVVQNVGQVGPNLCAGVQWKHVAGYLLVDYSNYVGLSDAIENGARFYSALGLKVRRTENSKWNLVVNTGFNQNVFWLQDLDNPALKFSNRKMYWKHLTATGGFSYTFSKYVDAVITYSAEKPGRFDYSKSACSYVTTGVWFHF